MLVTEDLIRQMLAVDEETGTVEFKLEAPRPAELAERICGLANSPLGGTILIGIENDTRQVVGLDRPHGTIDRVWQALRLVRPAVPDAEPTVCVLDGRSLVVLSIPPNQGELYQASGVFYIRKGSQTVPMTKEEVEARLLRHGTVPWERRLCLAATLDDLDLRLVERYLSFRTEGSRQRLRFTTPSELLIALNCAGTDPTTGTIHPTHVGLLLFGLDPQLYLPQSEVVCIQYADDLGGRQYLDRKTLLGSVPALIDAAANFLTQHLNLGGEIVGFKRQDRPEYPPEALREAVTNAIVHRDYSQSEEAVRVFLFPTRIEVHSPGLLVPGLTIADLIALRAPSRPRNYLLASYLREFPGYMERVGSGIRLMVQEMDALGLPPPEFREQHEFVVTFHNGQPSRPGPVAELNDRQVTGLGLVRERGSLTSSEYAAATGCPDRTALRDLRDLVDRGILIRKGNKRSARYYLR